MAQSGTKAEPNYRHKPGTVEEFCERPGSLASNITLFTGSAYALKLHGGMVQAADFRSIHMSIGVLCINAGLGILTWCIQTKEIYEVYVATYEVRQLLYVGALNSELYFNAEYSPITAYLHLMPALLIPLCTNFTDYDMEQITDLVVIVQLISCFYICYKTENKIGFYACGTAILSTFFHTLLRALKQEDIEMFTFQELDINNLILTAFALFAAKSAILPEAAEGAALLIK